ncbi:MULTISPECIES: TadE/TadG family type IV pilus assembly protein [Paraburkholderia]|uniref:TadE/TadG family type IV pilus assembly protein n=1 Tax=Paraburkholderia TaxID=1822464 RepID=UPI0022598D83|nr:MULTISPECIES: TadE family protein [Paraburkholderia]MCX4164438.1 pilus assembly protein [Paraburkholderia megapolitana]MDN7159931.1 pilus assembly protein [Paraburkholderia sp. CHISQ3]MDQ6496978.1 pilus assembly protein [Paraburkholderia megapolitana]
MSLSVKQSTVRDLSRRHIVSRHAQRGATAIEFALVFPLFFAIFYAIVTFSLIFVAQQSLTLASEEGARAALNYQAASSLPLAVAARASNAASVAASTFPAMISRGASSVAASATCGASMQCITVTVTYNYAAYPLVPKLPLLGMVVPSQLSSSATVQLNPVSIF